MTRITTKSIYYGFIAPLALALALAMGGCTQDGREKSENGKPELPRLALGYFPNVTHAQALVGVERGDFARALEGKAKVETSTYNAGPSVIEGIFAGHLDIAYIGPSPTLNGYIKSKGEEVRVIAGAVENGVLILGNAKRGITKMNQLRGGRIATPQLGNTQDVSARHYLLKELGATLKEKGGDTEIIPIQNPDIEILFEKDQIDAAWVPEPWASRFIGRGLATLITPEHELWPEKRFVLTNIIVRKKFLDEHPDVVLDFLKVHIAITAELQQDRHALANVLNDHLEKLTHKRLPDEWLTGALNNVEFGTEPDRVSFERFLAWGQDLGFLSKDAPPIDGIFATELLHSLKVETPLAAATEAPRP